MTVPVTLVCGFLGSGKTSYLQGLLEDGRMDLAKPLLLLRCEDGEEAYDRDLFAFPQVRIEEVGRESLTARTLKELGEASGARQVLIEYNGMWALDELFGALPEEWKLVQTIAFVDASSAELYYINMKHLVADKIRNSDFVVCNRLESEPEKENLRKLVRSISFRPAILYDYVNGETEYEEEEDWTFSESSVTEIPDEVFGRWYEDLGVHAERYEGREVCFNGTAARVAGRSFLAGRHVTVCCEADARYCFLRCTADTELEVQEGLQYRISGSLFLQNPGTGIEMEVKSLTALEDGLRP